MPKVGLDDYFLTHTLDEFNTLPRLTKDEAFGEEIKQAYWEWVGKKKETAATPIIGRQRRTDMGNAERLYLREKNNIAWSMDAGWRYWDDKRWQEDTTHEILRRAKACIRKIYIEAAQTKDQEEREKLAVFAAKSEAAPRVNAMISMCEENAAVDRLIWDKNDWLLNLKNGTLNLETGEFYKHRREDFITKLINVDYNSTAECPLWNKFLERVIPDPQDRLFLQKSVGYSLTGSTREQVFFILYGTGRNGKSTFLKTIRALLADYAGLVRTEAIMIKKSDSNSHLDNADLKGLRFAYAVENEENQRLATSLVKQMTGGEEMKGRQHHQKFSTFTPTHKLWIGCNHKPNVPDTDFGFWRRVRQIPFTEVISDDEDDRTFGDKLLLELPGILRWAIDGHNLWITQGLQPTANIKAATEKYQRESDILADFYEEYIDFKSSDIDRVPKKDLRQLYEQHCEKSGEKPLFPRTFAKKFRERGAGEVKSNNVIYWTKIALRSETAEEPNDN